ncbi:lipase [Arthrobacter glacialis]|uniref:Lipase n=1 Tax=Arthrobacter glacialis TaxID=1664 RepID=A0A2S3ZWL8_ARTGL|nr:lipase [Arthrobacter glacialis]
MLNWTTTSPIPAGFFKGAQELEQTGRGTVPHRLPAKALAQANHDAQLVMAEAQPSGVRLAFRSSASTVELDTVRSRLSYSGAPAQPDGVIELVVNGAVMASSATRGGNTTTIDMATGAVSQAAGPVCTSRFTGLPEGTNSIELWLPHNEQTEVVALRTDASVELAPATGLPVWLHHGSSISHGSNATRPTAIWPAVAARLGGVELSNMALRGSALLDQFTARAMRDAPADLISVKIGINLVNLDLMRLRAFGPAVHGFLDTIRDGHPTTPLLVVSPIHCAIHEGTPGPGAFDLAALSSGEIRFCATGDPADIPAGKLTLQVIRQELERIVRQRAQDDVNIHYLDGLALYGAHDENELPLPDALHPDETTHHVIGERFAALAFAPGAPFGA